MPAYSTVACVLLSGFAAVTSALRYPDDSRSTPTVDLGYEVYTAASFDESDDYYSFTNIRYAAPPTGNLRFARPAKPKVDRSAIQDGSTDRICPQAAPAWALTSAQFVPLYLSDPRGFNASVLNAVGGDGESGGGEPPAALPQDPRENEDCLFLDVYVPASIYHSEHRRYGGRGKGAKVLVWIHGGGFVRGSKDTTPGDLLETSEAVGEDGPIVFVSINYRLGALGWSSGPSFEEAGGVSNAALYDQQMALEWVRRYIGSFGGDGNDITVIGESAGASSIMHLITAFGGKVKAPFNKAIIQSPGFFPALASGQGENAYERLLELTGSGSLEEIRALPSEAVIGANTLQVGIDSLYGQATYGPTVGDAFVPDLPGRLLQQGGFDRSVQIMTGHNLREGLTFTTPFVSSDEEVTEFLQASLPRASDDLLDTILDDLYPPVFDGSLGYIDQISRLSRIIGDTAFDCNTFYLHTAYNRETFAYIFAVQPSLHGQDVPYTFYDDESPRTEDEVDVGVARELQRYIVSFTETGRPSGEGVSDFPTYGDDAQVVFLSPNGSSVGTDTLSEERCRFWQDAPYF